ncbi:MAG: hydantoinase B/oxoprolinase family protein, partial [Alphaproteobacteria bacterium]|nr:hydantoinase B/oxoprolinase family protein [Alphaproteobacteria bacterium]
GGWGACAIHDGAGPFRTMAHGDTRVIPAELLETMYPFVVEAFSLRPDSGGPGKHRGGLGYIKRYRILEPCTLRVDFDRILCPPWGVMGGHPAESGRVVITRHGSEVPEVIYKCREYQLAEGDIISAEIGGGGGYGPPQDRSLELIVRDVARGYVSAEAAKRDYGVSAEDLQTFA